MLLQLQLAAADRAAYCCRLAEIQSAVGLATIGLMLASRFIFKVRHTNLQHRACYVYVYVHVVLCWVLTAHISDTPASCCTCWLLF
jgi:hypothetical protein